MKKIDTVVMRENSILTGKKNLEPLLNLENFPVFFGCVDSPEEEDICADMKWAIDPDTGVIQLTELIPLDVLYQEQHVDGFGKTWEDYYTYFAKYIAKNKPNNVLEIGGGIGVLAEKVIAQTKKTQWTIIEPNPLREDSERIKLVEGFFDSTFTTNQHFDTVTFSQVMEHVYEPHVFLKDISSFLRPGDKFVFAYPNLALWLEKKFTNALNFEHTMLFTDYFIDILLPQYQFKVTDKQFYKEHSVLYTAEKTEDTLDIPKIENKYKEYKSIFLNFVKYHKELVTDLNLKIESAKDPVYLFGAHIFATYLFAFGLEKEKIVTILDNSNLKKSRRMYGTNFIVDSPDVLKGRGKVNVILKAGLYNDEIKEQILAINDQVEFW